MPTRDPYGLVSSGLPPELAAEIEGVNTRKAIAQAMLKQSMSPLQAPQVKGRFQGSISPLQGIAQMFQAYTGSKGLLDAQQATADVGQKYQEGQRREMEGYERRRQGTPEMPVPENVQALNQGLAATNPEIPVSSIIPAKQGDPKAAVAEAMVNPYLRGNAKVLADLKAMQPDPKLGSWFDQTTGRKQAGVVDLADPTKLTPIGGPQSKDSQMGGAMRYVYSQPIFKDGVPGVLRYDKASDAEPTFIANVVNPSQDPQNQANIAAGREAGKDTASVNVKQHEAAISAFEGMKKEDALIKHLKESKAITGLGSGFLNDVERAKVLFTGNRKAGVKVTDTELLKSMLGSQVFPMISSLGIGARGLDTPEERRFLMSVMTGDTSMNKETLVQMAELRKKYMQRAVERWNERIDKGELDSYFKSSGRTKERIGQQEPSSPRRVVVDY